ncbi:RsmB/NOP family class I SAM-dependent RNA methyltransferase [Chitinophaga rhizosphaerae]|uniref:RsmB/NOP family class I SAM-dependent RNA methyltransferase n=1 Tax=Chitinophaga rhizosphaerae TaxID=1864947 RepID=UPI0013DF06B7|nr:RsmB/NOP family class I SAM-dependent RNA methyltransferase [Chitinophaga rhizosphaerae]
MTRWENYLRSAAAVLEEYDGSVPLHHFLKQFFKSRPQMGSRDRKTVQQLVYRYYRLGRWQTDMPVEDRLLLATFLCENAPDAMLASLRPEFAKHISSSLAEKLAIAQLDWDPAAVFPFQAHLSPSIEAGEFTRSFLQQPRLFIRARPGKRKAIVRQLEQAGVVYATVGTDAIALPNGTKTEAILPEKSWYEIQDLSSQETGLRFHPKAKEYWWDCCAASGGKSILLHDHQPDIRLLVSDVRSSILDNLRKRFAEAGIRDYASRTLDLTDPRLGGHLPHTSFNGIILDAPCTGSGTWGRSPENLYYFEAAKIAEYAALQKKIAKNVSKFLAPGGTLVYITCSVFREENEDAAAFLERDCGLRIVESTVVEGFRRFADSMFVTVAQRDK